ncbi:MAG: hypothetical protein KA086_03935 [Brachymonas sp.]|nr:hypothetical protein [Brachymonas sp.]
MPVIAANASNARNATSTSNSSDTTVHFAATCIVPNPKKQVPLPTATAVTHINATICCHNTHYVSPRQKATPKAFASG